MISTFTCFVLGVACASPQPSITSVSMRIPTPQKAGSSVAFQKKSVTMLRSIPSQSRKGTYATGKLAGSTVSDLYALYIGRSGTLPKTLTIDWSLQLQNLWARKAAISKTGIVKVTGDMLVAEYARLNPERMSIGQYESRAGTQAHLMYRSLDWGQVGEMYFVTKAGTTDTRKLALLKRVSAGISGRTLVAYNMTELFPSSGNYSGAYLDFLLRNAGLRYVESLPAIHDPLTSFGSFQFTSNAVYDTGSVAIGGASRVNRALPKSLRIPGSVTLLRGDQHLRAAYLFAVSNLAVFIRRLDEKHLATFERVAGSKSLQLAQFIATAHNKPAVAYSSGTKWLTAKAKSEYRTSCPAVSRRYATKTFENFQALSLLAAL